MQRDVFLDYEIDLLQKSGSVFAKEELIKLREILKDRMKIKTFDRNLEFYLESMEKETKSFLKTESIRGISSCISFNYLYINFLGGNNLQGQKIHKDTLFDIASITKLYTVLLALLFKEKDLLDIQKNVKEVCPNFSKLDNYTIDDLLYMRGELRTEKRITDVFDRKEAEYLLENMYIFNENKEEFVYTDMGLIVLSKVMEQEIRNRIPIPFGYADIMKLFLLKPLHLHHTTFFPTGEVAGNGRLDRRVNDPKTRILGGISGSAGLFTSSIDLSLLARELFSAHPIITAESLHLLSENVRNSNKGIAGLYQKYADGTKTYVPKEYSRNTFASEGSTGSVAIFDMQRKIHNNILVDSVLLNQLKKPSNFAKEYNDYQKKITDITLELYLLEKYYGGSPPKEYCLKI